MILTNSMPLVGIFFGIFVLFIILSNRRGNVKNKEAKSILIGLICMTIHFQFDSFVYLNGIKWISIAGYSYFHYHLSGALMFLFIVSLFKLQYNLKSWLIFIVVYTIIRCVVLFLTKIDLESDSIDSLSGYSWALAFDFYASSVINLYFMFKAYRKLKNANFAVVLSRRERINYQALKKLLLFAVIIKLAILQSKILGYYFDNQLLSQYKFETIIASLFFFALAFFAVRFPVYSIYGDHRENNTAPSQKYAKSSLKISESSEMWDDIINIMNDKKAYRNPEYRLNDLADCLGKALHHVSQIINEREGISFSEFINKYRIEEAKQLLVSDKSRELTILAIAYEVGFNSKSAFYSAFKKSTNLTPSAYKNSMI
ncbi:MAG: AraC family transcriptional regulator [Marinifilaceae bacterium]